MLNCGLLARLLIGQAYYGLLAWLFVAYCRLIVAYWPGLLWLTGQAYWPGLL